jgi:hypothetical protein
VINDELVCKSRAGSGAASYCSARALKGKDKQTALDVPVGRWRQ